MRCTSWLRVSLALLALAFAKCSESMLLERDEEEAAATRSASLARLLRHLASEYFHGCVLTFIYDTSHESPLDFRHYFADLPLTFACESLNVSKGEIPAERRPDKCTNYVVFLDNVAFVKHILGRDVSSSSSSSSRIVVVTTESSWEVRDFLKSDVAGCYANLLIVCHSSSGKSAHGAYLLYSNKLYADGSGASQPLFLASWLNDSLSRGQSMHLFEDKLKRGFMGHRLVVSAAENPPFTIKRSRGSNREEVQWDGLEVRILQLAASYLNLSLEFTEPRTRLVGSVDAAKADVAQGLASMAIGGIYHTIDLFGKFDATTPHYEDCASFISLASSALPKYRAVLGPFQTAVWIMLCASYFVLIIPLTLNSNHTIISLMKQPARLNNMFWFVFSTYTNSFVVKSPLLDYGIAKNSITLLLGIYWIFTIIITACYTGSIVAFITLPVFPAAMERAEDLAYYRYRVGTLDHNGWERWFNASQMNEPFLKKLFRKTEYVPSLMDGLKNASRAYFWPYAFLASRTALDYLVQTDFAPSYASKRSLMHVSNECFVRYQVVQLFPSDSLYTNRMNKFIARASEHGLLDHIVRDIDWQVQRIASSSGKKITKGLSQAVIMEDRVLTVEDTQGMFLILGSGMLMALLSLSFEKLNGILQSLNGRKHEERDHHYCPHPTPRAQLSARLVGHYRGSI